MRRLRPKISPVMKRFQADLIGPCIAEPSALKAASACTVTRQHWSRSAQIQLPCSRHCHQISSTVHAAREVVTDQAVPEGHKGLHGFLYGEQGAEVHENSLQPDSLREEEDTGATAVEVERYVKERLGENRAGVYAIRDSSNAVQYVGYARSILSAVKAHLLAVGPERCSSLQTRVLPPRIMASRGRLQADAEAWLMELPSLPPGNAADRDLWEGKPIVADQETYEEKKLKMQKAMGEKLGEAADADAEQRRQNLLNAVGQDDWSSVIDAQTQETVDEMPGTQNGDNATVMSPFRNASVQNEMGQAGGATAGEMSVATVDTVLNDVRPYLIADGGDVEVVSVEDGVVSLRLQGACGTCASSSATMKMGIERALQGAFGERLREVKQVDAIDTRATVAGVDSHLDMLRPAIKSYGGSVKVLKVNGPLCEIQYTGPPPLGMGIVAAIKDKFPDIASVELSS